MKSNLIYQINEVDTAVKRTTISIIACAIMESRDWTIRVRKKLICQLIIIQIFMATKGIEEKYNFLYTPGLPPEKWSSLMYSF